jgi:hypothetical protein
MRFKCEIDMDNAAFTDNPVELESLLKVLAIRMSIIYNGLYEEGNGPILDHNGNRVGEWRIEESSNGKGRLEGSGNLLAEVADRNANPGSYWDERENYQ